MIGFSRSQSARITRWLGRMASRVAPGCGFACSPTTAREPERSAPVQKLSPVAVRTTARMSGSLPQRSSASRYAARISGLSAFLRSGRLSTIQPTPSSIVNVSACVSAMECDSSGGQLERPPGIVVEEFPLDLGRQREALDLAEHPLPLQQRVVGREADLVAAPGLDELEEGLGPVLRHARRGVDPHVAMLEGDAEHLLGPRHPDVPAHDA